MTEPQRFVLPAYAYEVAPGDRLDGRQVTAIDDPDRPDVPIGAPPFGPGTVTVHFAAGEPLALERMSEVEVSRDAAVVLARLNPPQVEEVL